MKNQKLIILTDSISALIAGLFTLALSSKISDWYQWPDELTLFMGFINIMYGCYSGFISIRLLSGNFILKENVIILILANCLWAGHCFTQIWYLQNISSIYGLSQLGFEGIYVIGLAYLEAKFLLPYLK
ncbi:hypothetical protein [Leptospira ilyithenensis]|uniref:Uncharacterized protein n=1 Tax=Leptospira ilyithenensis TaxID=2484901 RepID=A0A4R9LVZ8_9LEPT|nr:hypothetical protein [Leptospira ilyithenensis]TGN13166.1 hypothetical protein EHS11_04525 [Leptospira ilyithenensis]